MSFSDDFLWGAASAAYQIEGAFAEGGKGPGIWDALSEGHVKHGDNGNEACDHYHLYPKDIQLMKQIGLKAYRFSVSWPRIMPKEHRINRKGLAFYKDLVEKLCEAGIRPMCTLYHWDLPMWIHEKGGWLCEEVSDYFAEYVEVVVEALSDKVEYWMTVNEASTFVGAGYLEGIHAPFETADVNTPEGMEKMCRLSRNVLLAHGKAVQVIRKKAIKAPKVGIAMDGTLWMPKQETEEEIEKARQITFAQIADRHQVNWWMDPIVKGTAQEKLTAYLTQEDMEIIHQPIDFMGYNCYKANNLDDDHGKNPQVYPGLSRTAMGWPITPDALYWAVRFYQERYQLPIMITENGMANIDYPMEDGMIHDPQRIQYLKWYLRGLKRAAEEGYSILGYLYWSVLDNFEWAEGYDKRFGLIYVDYRTQERIFKDSGIWYARVIAENGKNL